VSGEARQASIKRDYARAVSRTQECAERSVKALFEALKQEYDLKKFSLTEALMRLLAIAPIGIPSQKHASSFKGTVKVSEIEGKPQI